MDPKEHDLHNPPKPSEARTSLSAGVVLGALGNCLLNERLRKSVWAALKVAAF